MRTFQTYCWSCGSRLVVPVDRQERRPETAGENTIDPALRVCVSCWKQIGRIRVSAMPSLASVRW